MIIFAEPMLYFSIMTSQRFLTAYRTDQYVNAYVTHTDNYMWTNDNIFDNYKYKIIEVNDE